MHPWKTLILSAVLLCLPGFPLAEAAPGATGQSLGRSLPQQLTLTYDLQMGDAGLTLGQGTYVWQSRNGRYSLQSLAQATGLTSLVLSGQIRQNSEGRLGPRGLIPDSFRQVRGSKKPETAHFDWGKGQVVMRKGEKELREGAQDLLSFPFHLALSVQEKDPDWIMPVTNGRHMRDYRFQVLGWERLKAAGEMLDVLHVQGQREGDGSLDVWLAPAQRWLPVRIRTQDENKGSVMLLTLARVKE